MDQQGELRLSELHAIIYACIRERVVHYLLCCDRFLFIHTRFLNVELYLGGYSTYVFSPCISYQFYSSAALIYSSSQIQLYTAKSIQEASVSKRNHQQRQDSPIRNLPRRVAM